MAEARTVGEAAPVEPSPAADVRSPVQALLSVLTGVGQIMFQSSPITGAFFLTGIAVVSPMMAAGAAVGSAIGTATACLLRYDRVKIHDGLYGYNASLVGLALLALHQPVALTFAIAAVGCVVSTLMTRAMQAKMPLPTYTAPFILTTWLALYVAHRFGVPGLASPPSTAAEPLPMTEAVLRGISEVMLQANVLTGALFVIGILLCSWKDALWAVVGSLIGLIIGIEIHIPEPTLSLGIYGYNAALAAMALALYRRSLLLPIVAAVLSVPITEKFPLIGLATLTAPFVLASWAIIAMDRFDARLNRNQPQSFG